MGEIVLFIILGGLVLEAICALFHRFDIDVMEGCVYPDRWIAWGACRSLDRKYSPDYRYFVLRLPSWDWRRDYDGNYRWHQRAIHMLAGRWHTVSLPLYDRGKRID
jgi:hypothetical protein